MRYRCERCRDEMDQKFERSHERICVAMSRLEQIAVERLLAQT